MAILFMKNNEPIIFDSISICTGDHQKLKIIEDYSSPLVFHSVNIAVEHQFKTKSSPTDERRRRQQANAVQDRSLTIGEIF